MLRPNGTETVQLINLLNVLTQTTCGKRTRPFQRGRHRLCLEQAPTRRGRARSQLEIPEDSRACPASWAAARFFFGGVRPTGRIASGSASPAFGGAERARHLALRGWRPL